MSSQENNSKRTPLYGWHAANGGLMEPFGGYVMPLWYGTGAKAEHMAVITKAGLFDTSHMVLVTVSGPGARDLLQWCFTRDLESCSGRGLSPLKDGEAVYGAFLDERGWCIDDAVVFQMSPGAFTVVVNASMGGTISEHLISSAGSAEVQVEDLSDRIGKVDIQGPESVPVLCRVLREPDILRSMRFFTFKGHYEPESSRGAPVMFRDGTPLLLSRSGYTGEIGFELFVSADRVRKVWEMLLEAGGSRGIVPCGLAARDSLRTGAGLPLSHQDIGPWPFVNHPWSFALPYSAGGSGFTKDFLGAGALRTCACSDYTYPFIGMDPRKVDTRGAVVLDADGAEIGTVLSCVTDMAIDRRDGRVYSVSSPDRPANFRPRGLSCGFVKVSMKLETGARLIIRNGNRSIPVEVTRTIRPGRTGRMPVDKFLDGPACSAAA